ncbi:MAG TPA: hypothetical protein VIG24_17175, partial [Acidimicrobiia bacterium]
GMGLQKAFLPAVATVGALAAGATLAAQAAIEDAAQQEELARQIQTTTGATEEQIAANEEFIASMEIATATADSELRPALGNLVRATGDVTEAQELLGLANDIATATGKDLGTVSEALSKAYQGNLTALQRLDPSLTGIVRSGADANEVFDALAATFGGAAADAADTVQGRFERMKIQMENVQEEIGYALLPIIEKFLPVLERMARFIGDNTELIIGIGVALGTLATAVVVANGAMKLWNAITLITKGVNLALGTSFTTLWVATGVGIVIALIGVIITLQMKFDILGKAVDGLTWLFDWLWDKAKIVMGGIVDGINLLIDAWNKLPLLPDIPKIEAGFLEVEDSVKSAAGVAEDSVKSWQLNTDQIAENTIEAEINAAMLERALIPQLENTKVAVNQASWELAGFYDQLDREDAFARFQDNLAAVQEELKGLEPGSAEFEQTMRDAYRAVQQLSDTLGYIPASLEKTLLYRIEIGDIVGAERLAGLISSSDTYSAVAQDELRFLGGRSSSPSGVVNNVTVNMPAGSNGADILRSLEREAKLRGALSLPATTAVR